MCNLYRMQPKDWHNKWVEEAERRINIREEYEVYPDREAPIIRNNAGKRELVHVRWGLPSSSQALYEAASARADKLRAKGKDVNFDELLKMEPDGGTTNVRNTKSKHWTRWLGVENRCLVPVTSFAEPHPAVREQFGRTPNAWFALDESCPMMFFAGIWVPQWTSVRKVKTGLETIDLFGFLTCQPNGDVAPIHGEAMPVLLTEPGEIDAWLSEPWETAQRLQRPLPDGTLKVIKVMRPF